VNDTGQTLATSFDLVGFYDAYPRLEEQFQATLDESVHPRGPELLYDLVGGFDLAPGTPVLDVGCGEGRHARALAERFRFAVLGLDPVPRHIEIAVRQARHEQVSFVLGRAERLPVGDASVGLVWCRDVLVHVADLERVYAEFHRVLRPGGRALVYQMFGTDRLEPREARWLFATAGVVPASADPRVTEDAVASSGLRVDECLDLGAEWGEYSEENHGTAGRKLLHAARLLRDPQRYTARYGASAYDIMLGDCLWHVYRMIGKLTGRVYALSRAPRDPAAGSRTEAPMSSPPN
jgi:SAM-dependent methyltransferase